ncbi:carbohydrate ABC transporter permease [Athalassotoga saccharophila]|uniref:carbohydrate ABC transporter permease n=1 Tax=Athalassotoga saccharophila TaxID=1441386 RepID=UPI0018D79EB0|nr:carbohydrate ABC transporter permease [Athalassotoga saccharophila]BBJ27797.1 L-arabinose transport system permease protein AraQ [Athalassotoga saccharophila]
MKIKGTVIEIILYIIAFAGAAIMLMPFIWMVVTSLKLPEEVQVFPPTWGTVNALPVRDINASIDHSSYSSVNYSALSLQQFLNVSQANTSSASNVLTVNFAGTPPLRGTIYLTLGNGGPIKYATGINFQSAEDVINVVDSKIYPSNYQNQISELKSLSSNPQEYIKAFFNIFRYGSKPIFSRIDFIDNAEKAIDSATSTAKIFMPALLRNPSLSSSGTEQQFVKEFLSSNEFFAQSQILASSLIPYKKGTGTLASDLPVVEKLFDNFFSKADLKQILIQKFGKVDPALDNVVNFYEQRMINPIAGYYNLMKSYDDVFNFYQNSMNLTTDSEMIFTFFTKKDQIQRLESAIKGSTLPSTYMNIALDIVRSGDLSHFIDNFINSTNEMLKSDLASIGLNKDQVDSAFRGISSVVTNMKILYGVLNPDEKVELDRMISEYSGNWNELSQKISERFGSEHPNSTGVLTGSSGQLAYISSGFSSYKDPSAVEKMLEVAWLNYRVVSQITDIYNNTYYTMKIIKAPSIISSIQYFPSNGSVKIFLKNINSVWFTTLPVKVSVHFTISEIFANLFEAYVQAWNAAPFARYYLNTVFVAVVTTFLNIVFGVMAAFAFSKLHFAGRNFFFMLFIATMMIPGEVLLVPNFITIVHFGWLNTYYALIIPWAVSAFTIFLIRQNFMTIPDELLDAAKIDGASRWRFLWTIMVPLSRPVIITGALLNFVGSWNAFLWVLIVTNEPSMRTLPVGLQNFSSNAGTIYNQLMAASTFTMLPIVILFLFAQRYFIEGIARTGIK